MTLEAIHHCPTTAPLWPHYKVSNPLYKLLSSRGVMLSSGLLGLFSGAITKSIFFSMKESFKYLVCHGATPPLPNLLQSQQSVSSSGPTDCLYSHQPFLSHFAAVEHTNKRLWVDSSL